MCYHIAFEVKLESILDVFPDLIVDHQLDVDFPTAGHISGFLHKPHQVMMTSRKDGKKHLALMMWGIVPKWIPNFAEAQKMWNGYKDDKGQWKKGIVTLNAIGEEMFEKTMYKEAAEQRRCVVFVDAFYESYHYFPIGKKGQRLKTPEPHPFHIKLKDNPYPFFMMAGIWDVWKHTEKNETTGELETLSTPCFAIVTTKANALMEKIHNSKKRMPVILNKEMAEEWISDGLSKERITEMASYQYPAEQMEAYTIPRNYYELENPRIKQSYPHLQEELPEFC